VVRLLLARGAQPDTRSTAFDLKDRDGIVGLQASLYWKGGLTALLFAARQGWIDTGKALIDGGASLAAADADFGFTPLMEAIFNGHLDFARMVVDRGADLNDGSLYLLIDQRNLMPRRDDRETVSTLLKVFADRGANPDAPFNNGKIPPRITYPAIRYGPVHTGSTPLLAAARAQDMEAARLLIERHAVVDRSTVIDHMTPLMAALGSVPVGRGRGLQDAIPMVKLLIAAGADVNAANSRGLTPLHYAARGGNDAAVELLALHGARIDVKDRIGRTPLDLANGVMTAVSGADGPPRERTAALLRRLQHNAL